MTAHYNLSGKKCCRSCLLKDYYYECIIILSYNGNYTAFIRMVNLTFFLFVGIKIAQLIDGTNSNPIFVSGHE